MTPLSAKPKVLFYSTELLSATQTFTLAVAESLNTYQPVFVGLGPHRRPIQHGIDSLLLTEDHSLSSRFLRNAYKYCSVAPGFHRKVRDLGAKAWHIEFLESGATGWGLLQAVSLPAVLTLHGSIECSSDRELHKTMHGQLYLLRRKLLFKRISRFLCVSNFIRQQAIRGGLPAEKLVTHYLGVDRTFFREQSRGPRQPIVLFVGRLAEKKGCSDLISAMAVVQRTRPDVQLQIVGDGVLRASLTDEAKQLGVNVAFLGMMDRNQIRERLEVAQVFCAPSVRAANGDCEGLPTVIVEAQAMGLPVVGTRHGGIPEAISEGETGLLVDEHDIPQLADALLQFLGDRERRAATGRAAVDRVATHFDLHKQAEALERIYQKVIEEP